MTFAVTNDARMAILTAAQAHIDTNPNTPPRVLRNRHVGEAAHICRRFKLVDAETLRLAGFPGAAREIERKAKK